MARDVEGLYHFCARIVEATADLACAFKPQIAYFAAQRAEAQLERLISCGSREDNKRSTAVSRMMV
jgi:orotidine-5'-phosphate decarboxylase